MDKIAEIAARIAILSTILRHHVPEFDLPSRMRTAITLALLCGAAKSMVPILPMPAAPTATASGCPPGTFASKESCLACPGGTFQPLNNFEGASCQACPEGQTTGISCGNQPFMCMNCVLKTGASMCIACEEIIPLGQNCDDRRSALGPQNCCGGGSQGFGDQSMFDSPFCPLCAAGTFSNDTGVGHVLPVLWDKPVHQAPRHANVWLLTRSSAAQQVLHSSMGHVLHAHWANTHLQQMQHSVAAHAQQLGTHLEQEAPTAVHVIVAQAASVLMVYRVVARPVLQALISLATCWCMAFRCARHAQSESLAHQMPVHARDFAKTDLIIVHSSLNPAVCWHCFFSFHLGSSPNFTILLCDPESVVFSRMPWLLSAAELLRAKGRIHRRDDCDTSSNAGRSQRAANAAHDVIVINHNSKQQAAAICSRAHRPRLGTHDGTHQSSLIEEGSVISNLSEHNKNSRSRTAATRTILLRFSRVGIEQWPPWSRVLKSTPKRARSS